jgi:nucleotide-binding universal stress UspA family protein
MKRILLPTDFSNIAWNAIRYALALLEEEPCTFYVLHTYTPAFYRIDYILGGPSFSAIPDAEVNRSVSGLEKTLSDMQRISGNPEHRFEMFSAFNILSHEINDLAEREKIDLVIMGTKGATGAREVFIGSNTVYALRKASVPVLVIPKDVSYSPIKRILLPSDYLSRYKAAEFQKILQLGGSGDLSVTVLHVMVGPKLSEEQKKNKVHLAKLLKHTPHNFVELQNNIMPDAVIAHLRKEPYDLLAMMYKKHPLLERIFERQNVDHMGFHVNIPFLAVRDTTEVGKREVVSVDGVDFGLNWNDLNEIQKI